MDVISNELLEYTNLISMYKEHYGRDISRPLSKKN